MKVLHSYGRTLIEGDTMIEGMALDIEGTIDEIQSMDGRWSECYKGYSRTVSFVRIDDNNFYVVIAP